MAKNNENQHNVEVTPAQAMDALYPKPPVVDPFAKVPVDVREMAIGYQDSDDRAEMIVKIREVVAGMDYIALLSSCSIGGAIHPGKLADALQSHLPKKWEMALRDDVDKTPEEQLATIVAGVPRGLVTTVSNTYVSDYGLTKEEQTRSLKKAIRAKAIEEVEKKVPLKVAKARQANYQDRLIAGMKIILGRE